MTQKLYEKTERKREKNKRTGLKIKDWLNNEVKLFKFEIIKLP